MLVVDVFTDPSCPWTWIASRWLKEVAPQRDLELRWRSYSLEIRDGGELPTAMPDQVRRVAGELRAASHRALRVFEVLRGKGEDAVDALYTEWGRRLFRPGSPPAAPPPGLLTDCLQSCGFDPELDSAGDDPAWDAAIIRSMEDAYAIAGANARTPTLVLAGDPPRGLTGPVMSPAPSGDRALGLWDAFRVLADEPGFFEVRRPRQMPSLPV